MRSAFEPEKIVRIGILPGQRVLIAGRTGSGKSYFARWIARQMSGGIILDPKSDVLWLSLPGVMVVNSYTIPPELADPKSGIRWALLRPPPEDLDDAARHFDAVLVEVVNGWANLAVVVDELYSLHVAGRPGPGLVALLTRGRSRGLSAIMATQRPAWISRFCLSESDALAGFALNLSDDRRALFAITGKKQFLERLPPREFLWYIFSSDFLARCAPIEE